MKVKIFTAAITADSLTGELIVGDTLQCASFTCEDKAKKWLASKSNEIYKEYGNEGESVVIHESITSKTLDIPVYVLTAVDHQDTSENCGLYTEVFADRETAEKHLKASVEEEHENGAAYQVVFNNGFYSKELEIAESEDCRFGWTIDKR